MSCPVCRIELTKDPELNYQTCKKCRREYFEIANKHTEKLEYSDIETVSENEGGEGEGPSLLCDSSDNRFFPAEYLKKRKKDESYLYEHFGDHVNIETREYLPT